MEIKPSITKINFSREKPRKTQHIEISIIIKDIKIIGNINFEKMNEE